MQAHVLTLNEFNMPKVFKDSDAMYVNIVYLILLEKGKFLSHPDMGVGLRSKYRMNNSSTLLFDLQNDIKNQINTYLPELTNVDISLELLENHILIIYITVPDGTYRIIYDQETDEVNIDDNNYLNTLIQGGN